MTRRSDPSAGATWDRHAGRYGAQEHLETAAVDAALEVAQPRAGERLVDLATGTGLVLRRLANRADGPSEALGVDRSPGMLAQVGALPDGWSVVTADARRVPRPDGWADVVTCVYLLQLLDEDARTDVLAEARRLLAPRSSSRLVVVTSWSDRAPVRAALGLLARARPQVAGGMRPLDPSAELQRAGFALTQRTLPGGGGYPSLVLGARART